MELVGEDLIRKDAMEADEADVEVGQKVEVIEILLDEKMLSGEMRVIQW